MIRRGGGANSGADTSRYGAFAQSQASLPLSKTTRQTPGASWRQIDVKVAKRLPEGSNTGPELIASVPDASTSTLSGAQEKGACGRS